MHCAWQSPCSPAPSYASPHERRAAEAALLRAGEMRVSGFVIREAHGLGAGAVVGLDVDQRDHAFINLLLRPLERRADVLRLLDIFAVGAEALGHDVVAGIA